MDPFDSGASEQQSESDVPVCLFTSSEDDDCLDFATPRDEKGGGECGTECGYLFGVKKACRLPKSRHYCEGSLGAGAFVLIFVGRFWGDGGGPSKCYH